MARLPGSSTCLLELGILRLKAAALLLEPKALPPVGVKAQHSGQRQLLDGLRQEVPEGHLHQLRPLLPEARLHAAITSPLWPEVSGHQADILALCTADLPAPGSLLFQGGSQQRGVTQI